MRMAHPDLPGQDIDVPDSAAPFHAAAGWAPADPVPSPESPVSGDKAGDTDKPAAKSRARKTSKEGESA